jgi:hypothetical protein
MVHQKLSKQGLAMLECHQVLTPKDNKFKRNSKDFKNIIRPRNNHFETLISESRH